MPPAGWKRLAGVAKPLFSLRQAVVTAGCAHQVALVRLATTHPGGKREREGQTQHTRFCRWHPYGCILREAGVRS